MTALDTATEIKLTKDISTDSQIVISRSISIDFGGYKLTGTASESHLIAINGGDADIAVTLKNGTIDATAVADGKHAAVRIANMLDSEDSAAKEIVTISKMKILSESYGISIFGLEKNQSTGEESVSVEISGCEITSVNSSVSTNGMYGGEEVSINAKTKLISSGSVGIFAPSNGKWTVDDSTITGIGGVDVRAGSVAISNTNIVISGTATGVGSSGPAEFNVGIGVYQWNGTSYGTPAVTVSGVTVTGSKTCDIYYGILNASKDTFDDATSTADVKSVRTGSALTINDASGALFTIDNQATSVASSVKINLNDSKMVVKSGSVFNCDLAVRTNKMSFEAMTATTDLTVSEGSIAIEGDFTVAADGSITVTGSAKITGEVTIPENAILTISDGAKLTVDENSTLRIEGTVTGSILNNGTIVAVNGSNTDEITLDIESIGVVTEEFDESSMENVKIEGTIKGTGNTYDVDQIVTIVGNTTITTGTTDAPTTLTINGKLVIPAGVTLTIMPGAGLVIGSGAIADIAGNIEILEADEGLGASLNVTGTMNLSGAINNSGEIAIAGTFNVADGGNVYVQEAGTVTSNGAINVKENGTITINGSISATGEINNAGLIRFDSEVPSESLIIVLNGNGAVEMINIMMKNGAAVQINDGKSTMDVTATTAGAIGDEYVGAIIGAAVSGITVSEKITVTKDEDGRNVKNFEMNIEGNLGVSPVYFATEANENDPSNMSASAIITINGSADNNAKVAIKNGITLGKDTKLVNTGKLVVESTIDATAAGLPTGDDTNAVTNSGTMTLAEDGLITVKTGKLANTRTDDITGIINAAMYVTGTTDEIDNYVTIDAALAAANAGTTTKISVLGEQTVSTSATVPAGVEIDLTEMKTLNIGADVASDVTLTIASGASVKGTVDSTDKVNIFGTIYADNKDNIKSNIRDLFSAGSDVKSEELNEKGQAVRTGWGKWTNIYAAMEEASAGTVVKANRNIPLKSDLTIPADVTLDTNENVITVSENVTLTINGTLQITKNSTSNTLVLTNKTAETKKDASVVLNGFIVSDKEISIVDDAGVVKTIAGAYYTVTASGVKKYYATTVETAATNIADADSQTITLKGEKMTLGDIAFSGTADKPAKVIVGLTDKLTAGTVTLSYATLVFNDKEFNGTIKDASGEIVLSGTGAGFSVASAEKLTAIGGFTVGEKGKFAVSGTVGADSLTADRIAVTGTLDVTGTTSIANATIGGSVNVAKNAVLTSTGVWNVLGNVVIAEDATSASFAVLYIGLSQTSVAAAAVIDGEFSFSNYVAVFPGSQVSMDLTDVDKTEFYIGSALYLTVYAGSSCSGKIASINGHIENAYFEGWYNEDGEKVADQIFGNADFKKVTAKVTNDVYVLKLSTGAGIENVAIDGVLYYVGMKVAYGTHTVTYTLKTYYEGTPTLYVNGTAQSGLTFTTEGTPAGIEGITYTLQLSGVSASTPSVPSSDNKDDGMGLTDILLIVLVVLIAVMAIMVALRMMRS